MRVHELFVDAERVFGHFDRSRTLDCDFSLYCKPVSHISGGIHCKGGLTQQDMKNINKLHVNRLDYLISLVTEGKWFELCYLVASYSVSTNHWDPCQPDDDGNSSRALQNLIKSLDHS